MPVTINGTTGITTPTYNGNVAAEYLVPVTSFKNRLINGNMTISQRTGSSSVTPINGQYTLDRWRAYLTQVSKYTVQQDAGAVTPPAGFTDYLGITSTSAYSVVASDYFLLAQLIEGYNVADLAWGTANAKTVTLSFWVRSSLTGTFGGALANSASNRSYPYTYTISSANTWEQKSVTIAGDTTGTWQTTTGVGINVLFGLGSGSTFSGTAGAWAAADYNSATGATSVVGTNGATLYITGVQLEVGTVATSFDFRSYGDELALCQRYYYLHASGGSIPIGNFEWVTSSDLRSVIHFPTTMRTIPSVVATSGSNYYRGYDGASIFMTTLANDIGSTSAIGITCNNTASGATQGRGGVLLTDSASASIAFNAEL